MNHTIAFPPGLSRFQPLPTILCYDDFDRGTNGWVDLKPNYRFEGFEPRKGPLDLTRWGPTMLSSATFAFPGTHGSMDGTYSLKLTTRPIANPYEQIPAPGSLGHAIKRMAMHQPPGLLQFEMWYTYTPEQDRIGLGEKDIRAFGFLFDLQDGQYRYMPGVRYLNAVNGELVQRWQYCNADGVTDAEWEYGMEGWCKRGIDPQWFGRRYADGHTDGFKDVPDGAQHLCYNESDDKINWMYLRLTVDLEKRAYVEMQSGNRVFDLRGLSPTLVPGYANIEGLLNPMLWVETDTDRRVFLYVDSVVISMGSGENA
ncbi:MAG TPA: hypothetical protein PKD09_01490 [Aggregatilinea sp.]|uniref:DUF6772 family protein n=1 Tax=Aggregatilinea sp. TaxID=2806333 RepID=UPI002B6C999B|nr:DUF6772 family protein [Aggregatilinea sp.]HML20288.1 hypothetical protein [Aggregatilinea sp.]